MKKLSCSFALQFLIIFFISNFIFNIPAFSQNSFADSDREKNSIPNFNITSPAFYYLPGETVKIPLYSNEIIISTEFEVKVYTIKDPALFISKQQNKRAFTLIGSDSTNFLNLLEEVHTFKRMIHPRRLKISEPLILNDTIYYKPVKAGVYIIRISRKNKIVTTGFFVTNLGLLTRFTQNSVLNYASNRVTSEPVDSVKFKVYFGNKIITEGISPGPALEYSFNWFDKDQVYRTGRIKPLIIAEKNGEFVVSDPKLYFNGNERPFSCYTVTSQPVYRPPNAVNFKIMLRELTDSGYTVFAKKHAVIRVTDPKGGSLLRKLITTDEFGSYSDSVILDEGAPLGSYNIKTEVTEQTDSADEDRMVYQEFNQTFSVEEYKKPEYEVTVKTDKEQYRDKEKIEIEVQSDYYFGSPVQDAEVVYNIYKKPLYRPWWYYSEYSWWYRDYYSKTDANNYENSIYIHTGKGTLNDSGNFKVTYTIDEDFLEGGKKSQYETDYIYIVSAGVVDKSRRMVTSTKDINVTRSDYFINAYADKYVCKPGEKIGLEVKARDFSDKPVEVNYLVTINRVVYEKGKRITTYLNTVSGKTSYLGDDIIYIETEPEGYYELEVTSFDSKQTKITDNAGCYVTAGKMDWWNKQAGTINIIPEKESYFPGETAIAFIEVPHDSVNLFITNYNNNIVSYWVEKIEGGSAYIKIPVTGSASPNFFFNVAYTKDGKLYSNSSSIAVIPRNKFLDVVLSSDKAIYKPQEEGLIKISVKDNLGNPVKNSEVTIGMIDESIYAIMPENVIDVKSAFYSPYTPGNQLSYNYNYDYSYPAYSAFAPLFEMYDPRSPENKICRVNGNIFDESGNRVSGVNLLINGIYHAAITNYEGKFIFHIPEDEYNISLVAGNYIIPGSIKVNLLFDKPNELDFKISSQEILFAQHNKEYINKTVLPKGKSTIKGTIKDEEGNPLIGARIEIIGTTLRTGTDEDGKFKFSGIPEGIYSLKCTYVGFDASILSGVEVGDNQTRSVNFKMTTGGVTMDTLTLLSKRKTIDNGSGKIIGEEFIDNTGIRGIENIVSKTSGVVTDEKGNIINIRGGRTNETQIIIDGEYTAEYGDILSGVIDITKEKEEFIEAVTRSDFKDKMLWLPAVYTDENGIAEVKVKFPDNLTKWRVTARVMTKNTDVGQNTFSMTSRKDLIIRVETPRFFQQNDEVTVSTIVHNYLDEEKTAKVTMKLNNLELLDNLSGEQLITLDKNEEKRVDWKVKVNTPIGIGNVLASALTNEESDAMLQVVPVQPFGLKVVNYSTYDLSKTSGSITKLINIPDNTDTRSASIKLGISPSLASSILGSLDYLIGYPYGCIEQTMSRFMPTVIALNTLKETGAPDDPYYTKQIPRMVQKGFDKIYALQHTDGGWGWWENDKSDPYMSAYVMYGLHLAQQNGYPYDGNVFLKGIAFLESSLKLKKLEPTTRAFITFVLASADITTGEIVNKTLLSKQFTLLAKKETSSISKALLSLAAGKMMKTGTQQKYITEVMREVNRTDEGKAYWGSKLKRYYWQDDNIITTALVLKALIANPQSAKENRDMIESAVDWLLEMKKGNAWSNTLQNAFIVYALTDYIKQYKELEPDYSLKIFVNGKNSFEKQITADDIFKKEQKISITGDMLRAGENEIRIEKSGVGKTYFTSAVTYYEKENKKEISETDNGFEISREYYELKKVFDEKKKIYFYEKKKLDGTVESGSEILVKVKVFPNSSSTDYFMLEDPIPAGCEHIKEDWAYPIKGENNYQNRKKSVWNWWYADKEIRDNRIVFFASYMQEQEYEFSYLLRAQIPGTFNIMPPKGMMMYYPEYNGSGINQVLKIIDKK